MTFRAPDSKPKHNAAQHRVHPTGFASLRSPCQRLTPALKLDFNRKSSDHKDSPASLFVGEVRNLTSENFFLKSTTQHFVKVYTV
jgi:hypothetical protein